MLEWKAQSRVNCFLNQQSKGILVKAPWKMAKEQMTPKEAKSQSHR